MEDVPVYMHLENEKKRIRIIPEALKHAPKDRNFLCKTFTKEWRSFRWHRSGAKWIEAWWNGYMFVPWSGHKHVSTNEWLDPIDWADFPRNMRSGRESGNG